jgi:CheY-like chemotaxis protein
MSKKLLLADDSITIQKVIGITFANEDYELSIVGDGDSALEKARASRPDLVLADVFMPGKNGYELCAAIKQDPAFKGVPVLLLAGTFEPFDEEKAIGAGADSWISKPFESQALISKVESLLASSSAASEPAPVVTAPAAPTTTAPQAPPVAPAAPTAPAKPAASDPWGDVDIAFDTTEDVQVFEDESDFVIADGDEPVEPLDSNDVWGDSSDDSLGAGGIDAIDSIPVEEPVPVAPAPSPAAPAPSPAAPAPSPAAPAPSPAAPAPSPAAPAPAPSASGVEARLAGMSETDLQAVVERVAGAILEKIAWEVVPDLAEGLIRDEIRKIKESAQ